MSAKKTIEKIAKIVVYVICAALAALIIYIMISNARKKVTFIFGHTTLWVMTDSMETGIPERSYILVKKIDAKDVKLNDVITFYSDDPKLNGAFNTHRVIEIVGDHEEFVTKGDNNPNADQYTAKADKVVAVYVRNMPFFTVIGRFLATKQGLAVMVIAMLALIIAVYVPDIVRGMIAKDKAEKENDISKRIEEEVERLKRENSDKDTDLSKTNRKE